MLYPKQTDLLRIFKIPKVGAKNFHLKLVKCLSVGALKTRRELFFFLQRYLKIVHRHYEKHLRKEETPISHRDARVRCQKNVQGERRRSTS